MRSSLFRAARDRRERPDAAGGPGHILCAVRVRPEGPRRATIGLIHGYADHAGRYAHVQDAWADCGVASVAIDLRGHGRAGGARGYCNRFGEFLDDAGELGAHRPRRGERRAVLSSWGTASAVSSRAGAPSTPPRPGAAWCSAPPSSAWLSPSRARRNPPRAGVASRLTPHLGIPSGLAGKDLTHDAARAADYDRDPLVFKKATARWFTETQRAQADAMARARAAPPALRDVRRVRTRREARRRPRVLRPGRLDGAGVERRGG